MFFSIFSSAVLALSGFPHAAEEYETGIDGTGQVREVTVSDGITNSTETDYIITDGSLSLSHRGEVLWVDRAHLNAIASEVVISGDGLELLSGWYLNNDRCSKYLIFGDGTPLWDFSMVGNSSKMDVSAGYPHSVFSATSDELGTFIWQTPSSVPSTVLPGALKQDISDDGMLVVWVDPVTRDLICSETATGNEVWSTPLANTGNGVNGVDISEDMSCVLVTCYDNSVGCRVFDMASGVQIGSSVGNYSQIPASISFDGWRFATAEYNGTLKFYEFDGNDWVRIDFIHSGDTWVTAVAISGDGETVICGTLDFNPYDGKVIVVDWPAGGTPSVLWEHDDYGDEVSSVDTSFDGEILIAGSYGKLNGTEGDVITVLDRSGGVILQVLDDIDEPGSIFSVNLSDDGSYATAGGKAVHARAWGNGGEVYGIRIAELGEHDVAVTAVHSPEQNLQVGDVVVPEVTVSNLGQNTESFEVHAVIESEGAVFWDDFIVLDNLVSGDDARVTFLDWTVPEYGFWTFKAYTALEGDVHPENDTLQTGCGAFHDALAAEILCPYDENTIYMELRPTVEIVNNGTYEDEIAAMFVIHNEGVTYFEETLTTPLLAPGEHAIIEFPVWAPEEVRHYEAFCEVTLLDDYFPDNNVTAMGFESTWEVIYDDGSWESYYWVGSLSDDMFAVRFTPLLDPAYMVTGGRLYVNSTDPFEWAMVCLDNGSGRPDFENPLQVFNDIGASTAPGWIDIPFDIFCFDSQDIWFVTRWYDGKALGVGTDMDDPVAGRCWWYNKENSWVNFTGGDYSFRLVMEPATGVEEENGLPAVFSIGTPYPNPVIEILSIELGVPAGGGQVNISLFDISGRCVETITNGFVEAGEHTLQWDRTAMPGGMYFIRMDAPGMTETCKVVILD